MSEANANPGAASVQHERLVYLDAVRGIAALAVLWGHAYLAFGIQYFKPIMHTPLHLFFDAYAAVTIFFVLSGYVLSVRYLDQRKIGAFNIWAFYIKRYCRIVLPFIAILVLSYIARTWLYQPYPENDPGLSRWALRLWSDQKVDLPAIEYLKSALMILPDTKFPLIPQAWTLRIEMGMSLALPFMILIACRSSWWLVLFTVIFIQLLGVYVFAAHFTLGILLAKHQDSIIEHLQKNALLSLTTLVLGIMLLTYRLPPDAIAIDLSPRSLRFVTGIGALLLLAWIMSSARTQAVLSIAPLRFLGRISYSLYLVHLIILLTLSPLAIHWLNSIGIGGSVSYWLALGVTAVGSIVLSAICFYLFEQPSIRLGALASSRINARLGSQKAASPHGS